MPLVEYWGLKAIATRLSLNRPGTALEWYRRHSLPIMLRRRGSHPRKIWYTHEGLLQKWELALSSANARNSWPNLNDKSGVELNLTGRERNCTGIGVQFDGIERGTRKRPLMKARNEGGKLMVYDLGTGLG